MFVTAINNASKGVTQILIDNPSTTQMNSAPLGAIAWKYSTSGSGTNTTRIYVGAIKVSSSMWACFGIYRQIYVTIPLYWTGGSLTYGVSTTNGIGTDSVTFSFTTLSYFE